MLIYNQAFDIYHTIFRMLQLTRQIEHEIEFDKLRILDFYLVFPFELLEIRSFRGFKSFEKNLQNERNAYERILDRKRVFYKMESIQMSSIKAIVAYGLFDKDLFNSQRIKRTEKQLPVELSNQINQSIESNADLLKLLTGQLANMDLYGHLGLKSRTNLIEFKYDTI
jgi:hypothetical protein